MKNFSITLTEDEWTTLKEASFEAGMTMADYVRAALFPETAKAVSVPEAVRRALARETGSEFTVPELFLFDEYKEVGRGAAGTLGRGFNQVVGEKYADKIVLIGKRNRQALYKRI